MAIYFQKMPLPKRNLFDKFDVRRNVAQVEQFFSVGRVIKNSGFYATEETIYDKIAKCNSKIEATTTGFSFCEIVEWA